MVWIINHNLHNGSIGKGSNVFTILADKETEFLREVNE